MTGILVLQEAGITDEIDFGALLEQIRSGDRNAENTLVQRFWRGLYFILFRQTGDQELSRDLTQDSLLLVVAKARDGEIEHPKALSSYIRKVGENKLIGHRRKQARQKTDADSEAIDRVADESESMVAKIRLDQASDYVSTVLAEMSHDRDREILTRYYLTGQDKNEICSALDLSKSQADVVLHRARQRLKDLIMRREGDGNGPRAADLMAIGVFLITTKEYLLMSHYYITAQISVYRLSPHEPGQH